MLKNYFKIAWRNLVRNRTFSIINIAGFALGLASCMLISLYVLDELSFDRFNTKADRTVRVVFSGVMQGGKINEAHVMPPTAAALRADYPEVLEATRIRQGGEPVIQLGEKLFTNDRLAFVDSNFFDVFTLPLLHGNPGTALIEPNSVVISETMAEKYFGNTNALGKELHLKDWKTIYKITGVMKEIPANSHFHFDLLASMATLKDAGSPSWMVSEYFTYLVLPEGYDYKKLEAKLPQTVQKYMAPQIKQGMGVSLEEFRKNGNEIALHLQPLTDIHLHSDFEYDLGSNGEVRYVYIFGAIAVIMLLIACINFMNLSTAGSSRRAREVGVRKVMGSAKYELIWQFLMESLLLTSIALIMASVICAAALPMFNLLSGKILTLHLESILKLVPALLLFGLFVGILAGSYPAFFLSSFKPIAVLKGGTASVKLGSSNRNAGLRSGLVVFQFFISITLIVGTTVVYQQLKFIQHKKLGYDKNQVLVIPAWALGKNGEAFRNEMERNANVQKISLSSYVPAGPSNNNNFMLTPENNPAQFLKTLRYEVDYNYIDVLGMEMAAGRNFSKAYGTDSTAIIINETAAKNFGWKTGALNKSVWHRNNEGKQQTYRIIGVVKDFHFRSMHERIAPLVMTLNTAGGSMIIKTRTAEVSGLLESMQKNWESFKPDLPFTYRFLDESYKEIYKSEQKTGQILGIFAALTIFVACLGLYGLATFTAEQRKKEIGVRKALGASVSGIVSLLSRDFLKPVAVAIMLAMPAAGWIMSKWLQEFAYKIAISWWMFALAGLLSVAVALFTVSFQSVKAAMMNPVKSLRSE
ncbi:ABC transporter permease [Dyadobacter sediminis]|uniref:FtsX-like permease family protein n=1 Tax=Dyadobacter sediminis TaxID=1493691 RepID=A0A5R9KJD4_9BACT|nr:ABC transporter permease [Dyadobacter sediminis]TLU96284.1 FtsX-like permease family protein [Dyadobacter sediminis]GGB80920.1 ABC transporter permease [Dyadobacter sediminis]